jgi:hypothetical protein
MKSPFPRFLAALFCFAFAVLLFADDFKSMTFSAADGTVSLPRVHGGQFMVIRNFTQEGITTDTRGVVMVTKPPSALSAVSVLTAAILDPTTSPDVINDVVIAGPADVTVTCGAPAGSHCFISFKKDSN